VIANNSIKNYSENTVYTFFKQREGIYNVKLLRMASILKKFEAKSFFCIFQGLKTAGFYPLGSNKKKHCFLCIEIEISTPKFIKEYMDFSFLKNQIW